MTEPIGSYSALNQLTEICSKKVLQMKTLFFIIKKKFFLCYASSKGTLYLIILQTLNITSENQITLNQRSKDVTGRTIVYNFERTLPES